MTLESFFKAKRCFKFHTNFKIYIVFPSWVFVIFYIHFPIFQMAYPGLLLSLTYMIRTFTIGIVSIRRKIYSPRIIENPSVLLHLVTLQLFLLISIILEGKFCPKQSFSSWFSLEPMILHYYELHRGQITDKYPPLHTYSVLYEGKSYSNLQEKNLFNPMFCYHSHKCAVQCMCIHICTYTLYKLLYKLIICLVRDHMNIISHIQ